MQKLLSRIAREELWPIDLFIAIVFSIFWGWFVEAAGESSQETGVGVLVSTLITVAAFLFVFLLKAVGDHLGLRLPIVVWIGVIGSFLYAFNRIIVYYVVVNAGSPTADAFILRASNQIANQFTSFLLVGIVLAAVLTSTMFAVRAASSLLRRRS